MTIYLKIGYNEDTNEEFLEGKHKVAEGVIPLRTIKDLPNGNKSWRPLIEPVPDREKEDSGLFTRTVSDIVIRNDDCIKTFIYTPTQDIDAKIERKLIAETDHALETLLTREEARVALSEGFMPSVGDYPFLDSEVGNTINPKTGQLVGDPLEAAQMIIDQQDSERTVLADRKSERLVLLKKVKARRTGVSKINEFMARR